MVVVILALSSTRATDGYTHLLSCTHYSHSAACAHDWTFWTVSHGGLSPLWMCWFFLLVSSSPPVLVPLAQPGMAKASISASMNGLPGDSDRKEWRLAKETRLPRPVRMRHGGQAGLELWPSPPFFSSSSSSLSCSCSSAAAARPPFSNLSNSSGRMKTAVKGDKGGYKLLINNNQGNYRKQLNTSSGRRWLIPFISSSPPRCTGPARSAATPSPCLLPSCPGFF